MKLTVLGRYGKFPNKYGADCSYLIESGSTKIVVDMGSGSLVNLNKILPYDQIDGIIISHLHGDHCSDAYVFRNIAFEYVKKGIWKSKLPFFVPKSPIDDFNAITNSIGFDIGIIENNKRIRIKDIDIEFFQMSHPLETYGMKIFDGQKTIAYTADTRYCENLPLLLQGADLALVDAAILAKDHEENMPHISVKEIAKLTRDIPTTILTHLEEGKEKEILYEAIQENKGVRLAEELKTIIL